MRLRLWRRSKRDIDSDIGGCLINHYKEVSKSTGINYRAYIDHWLSPDIPRYKTSYLITARTKDKHSLVTAKFKSKWKFIWFILRGGLNKDEFKGLPEIKINISKMRLNK